MYTHWCAALAKVSDRNLFRANQNYSDSFRYLYLSQCKSFRINPKNVLYLVWWKTVKNRSDLIRSKPNCQSESIRMNPVRIHSGWKLVFGLVPIPSDSCLGLNWIGGSIFYRFSLNEIQNVYRIDSEWFALARIQVSEWNGIVLIGSE